MGQIQKVFNRYEKKFLLDENTYNSFKRELDEYMLEDEYGLHTIRNIYYDTPTDELIRTSIEGPKYKEKFRVRCYGTPTYDSMCFLEIKKKYKGLVNKRRVAIPMEEAEQYYAQLKAAGSQEEPPSYGLNSTLVKDGEGRIYEETWTAEAINAANMKSGKTVEITPIYYLKDNTYTKTFFIDGYEGLLQEKWGTLLCVYPYYKGSSIPVAGKELMQSIMSR